MVFGQTDGRCKHNLNRERVQCKTDEANLPIGQLVTAGPQARRPGGKAEGLSLGSYAVFKNTGAIREDTPCPSHLSRAEAREEMVQLSSMWPQHSVLLIEHQCMKEY